MIVSASYKTDIPAFYGDWFIKRLKAGYCRVVNPYGGQLRTVPLDKSVESFVFWTRNLEPFFEPLHFVAEAGFPFIVQDTVTGYPRALDYATVDPGKAVGHLRRVSRDFGAGVGVWRYDPVVFTSLTPPDWHRANFARLAQTLEGAVDEVVVSFAQIYRKTGRNMAAAARAHAFGWWDPPPGEKCALLADLAAIAAGHGMDLTLCAQPDLLVEGVREAACIDAGRLGRIAGRTLKVPRKPHRKTCCCWASRDIGEYDTCPHGCVYCYAVNNRTLAKRRFKAHDPDGEFLFPPARHTPPVPDAQGTLF